MSTPSVTVTTQPNTVSVSENGDITTVTATTAGPQGASFSSTNISMDDSAKVDGSVVYYSSTAGEYLADNLQTILSLVDGGNF